jgi:hypothetical protein
MKELTPVKRILKVLRAPTVNVTTWYLEIEDVNGIVEPRKITNSAFMGLCLKLRMIYPALVCPLPEMENDLVNFGR